LPPLLFIHTSIKNPSSLMRSSSTYPRRSAHSINCTWNVRRPASTHLELSIAIMISSMGTMTSGLALKMCMQYTAKTLLTSVSCLARFCKCRPISTLLYFINKHSIPCVQSNLYCIMYNGAPKLPKRRMGASGGFHASHAYQ
jgi:hypothetical protein